MGDQRSGPASRRFGDTSKALITADPIATGIRGTGLDVSMPITSAPRRNCASEIDTARTGSVTLQTPAQEHHYRPVWSSG